MNTPTNARAWIDLVLDPGYELLFDHVVGGDPLTFPGYLEQLERARAQTSCTESVLVASGAIDGARAIVISFEFAFLGGSMGVAAGERICLAFELAARERVPVIALTATGGARMQEGMLALAQMPATLVARHKLVAANQPFIAYLRNPTTGGVYASFASSADVLWAEPGATIGFAGPRVARTFTGRPLPEGSHTAEWGVANGLLHETVDPVALRARLQPLIAPREVRATAEKPLEPGPSDDEADPFETVRAARAEERLRAEDFIVRTATAGGPIVAGVGFAGGRRAIVIAHTRAPLTARAYRGARDAIATAQRLRLPIVTIIDTPGADPSSESEADGIAREISRTFEAMLAADVPTVACVIGEGGSGGALALAATDRLLIREKAFFSVIAPEGAAAILKRDDVEGVARDLKLTARDLRAFGIADAVIPETGRDAVHQAVVWALADAEREGAPTKRRYGRWRLWKA